MSSAVSAGRPSDILQCHPPYRRVVRGIFSNVIRRIRGSSERYSAVSSAVQTGRPMDI